MIIDKVFQIAPPGTIVPKPEATEVFRVKAIGYRRGKRAIIYLIPRKKHINKYGEKGINESEFEKAYTQLMNSGQLTRKWFKKNLNDCDKEGPCNFTTVGGLFILMGIAEYNRRGVYLKI